jgi:hypothetical protein
VVPRRQVENEKLLLIKGNCLIRNKKEANNYLQEKLV